MILSVSFLCFAFRLRSFVDLLPGLATVNTKSLGSFRLFLHATRLWPNLKFSMLPPVGLMNCTPSVETRILRGMVRFMFGLTTSTLNSFGSDIDAPAERPMLIMRPRTDFFFTGSGFFSGGVAAGGGGLVLGGSGAAGAATFWALVAAFAAAFTLSLGVICFRRCSISSFTVPSISPSASFTAAGFANCTRRSFFPTPGMLICRSS